MGSSDNHLKWLAEPLEDEPSLIRKPMFGALAYYLHGMLVLVLSDRDPPWKGVLVPTERQFHDSLMGDYAGLAPHPILGKWLYLPVTIDDFESIAADIVQAISEGDPRIGVEPKPKKRKAAKGRPKRKSGRSNSL